jgi:hypothetical protein
MLKRLSSEAVPQEIHKKLDVFFADLQAVGVFYIGHGVISDEGNHTGYFSNSKWGEIYVQKKFFFKEPILENYEVKNIDLITWKIPEDINSIGRIRNEFTHIASGMTICKKEGKFNTFFNIGFDNKIDLIEFSFFKRDLLLAYFDIFNNYHLAWRKCRGY